MKEVIVDNFDYNFFPCCFNVDLKMDTKDYELVWSYGTPFEDHVEKTLEKDQEF